MTETSSLAAGFADPVIESARTFRAILEATARPGRVFRLATSLRPPAPLSVAAAAVALTLSDSDARLWLAPGWGDRGVDMFLRFHTGAAPVETTARAAFALGPWDALTGEVFPQGTPDYPDRGTTLIVETPVLTAGTGRRLTGPGIETEHRLDTGLPDGFWASRARDHARFPLGYDMILTCGDRLAALPRTTRAGV
jgi:alpha-D-ribose 1-methylphosphonate 5-triphosphate synthase subunit PhnH